MPTWIFQGNPKTFDITSYLGASLGEIRWLTNRHAKEMSAGDKVYLWVSAGKNKDAAGIIAEGVLLEQPCTQPDDELSRGYWTTPQSVEPALRVRIQLQRVANKEEVLKRDWLKGDEVLQNLSILKMSTGTNFPVTPDEAKRLARLWARTGVPFSQPEVIASLLLYEQTRGAKLSIIARSEVEKLAQKIGRTPAGVYDKLMNFRALDPREEQKGLSGDFKLDTVIWDMFFDSTTRIMNIAALQAEYARLWEHADLLDREKADNEPSEVKRLMSKPLDQLMKAYESSSKPAKPLRSSVTKAEFERDPRVVAITKLRAEFSCEVENCKTPLFRDSDGVFYVEVHHLVPLADGGDDTIENTACLCAQHHRLLHFGAERAGCLEALMTKRGIERNRRSNQVHLP